METLLIIALLATAALPVAAEEISVSHSKIQIEFAASHTGLPKPTIVKAVQEAATSVADYYGKFPAPGLKVDVEDKKDSDMIFGRAFGAARIELHLGEKASEKELMHSWMLTHEMSHLAFPDLIDQYLWMEEGLATYIEPVMRARRGIISETKYWKDILDMMEGGLPLKGEPGLNETDSLKGKGWERWRQRTYWGGAIYWFVVDYEIRTSTQNKKSLRDVLQAILNHGGDGGAEWSIEKVFRVGKKALGSDVLREQYLKMGPRPWGPDIAKIWRDLGVSKSGKDIHFNDSAPATEIRKAMIQ